MILAVIVIAATLYSVYISFSNIWKFVHGEHDLRKCSTENTTKYTNIHKHTPDAVNYFTTDASYMFLSEVYLQIGYHRAAKGKPTNTSRHDRLKTS